ncbi:MAG: hypothetical protein ACREDD_12095 [Methylocella sp.]
MSGAKKSFDWRGALPHTSNSRGSRRRVLRDRPANRGGGVLITAKLGYPRASWKSYKTVSPAATGAGLAPINARKADYRETRRRKMAGQGAFSAAHEKTREFKAWILPYDLPYDKQGFHLAGRLRKKLSQGVNTGVV